MPRAVLVLLLALITFEVSGLAAICGDSACDEDCPSDASGGQCAPNCQFCSCSPLPTFARPASAVTEMKRVYQRASWVDATDTPVSPDPAAILHVPKRLLA
ncbi:MAG: hypothetical protein QOI23_168 [Chloroflexota bacterium]|nr:hypothetical protein [Chloroflexota bacterium]